MERRPTHEATLANGKTKILVVDNGDGTYTDPDGHRHPFLPHQLRALDKEAKDA